VRPSVESGPVNLARVLALEEKGLGLSVLEAEDLAVTTDVELALFMPSANVRPMILFHHPPPGVSLCCRRDSGVWTSGGGRTS
jgi:hypothetical protein